MSPRFGFALAAYFALSAAIVGGIVYGIVLAGFSLWVAIVSAFVLFPFVNGSLAYRGRIRQLRSEGKEPPRYLQYLFFPDGLPKFKDPAPRCTHIFVGIAAALTGVFFVFCGVALAFDADWSRIAQPLLAAGICIALATFGVAFLYLAWRLLSFDGKFPADVG